MFVSVDIQNIVDKPMSGKIWLFLLFSETNSIFCSFRELTTSATALRASHNYPLAEKPMKCAYAKRDSDAVLEYLGIGNAMLRKKGRLEKSKNETKQQKLAKKAKLMEEKTLGAPVALVTEMDTNADAPKAIEQVELRGNPDNPPNTVLFLENLPTDSSKTMIDVLFNQYDGFKEVRMVPDKPSMNIIIKNNADIQRKFDIF